MEFVKVFLSDGSAGEELDELCDFHRELAAHLEDIVLNKKKQKTYSCILSPRGHGKSFWTSFAFPLWCIAYEHTSNILIVTSEGSLGKQFVIDIKTFLEDNDRFIETFGDLVGRTIWTTEKIACRNGVCVSSKGSGMATRGVKIFGKRPSVIICDDILSEDNSSNTDQRKKLYDWYMKVLDKCGSKYCSTVLIGTLLNDACLLAMMLAEPEFIDYYRKKYQAVIEFSDSPLWDQWLKIRNDLSLGDDAARVADEFYFKHRKEMLKGTKVLWDRYPDTYLELMKEKAKDIDAFATELQNDGILKENQEFKDEWIDKNLYEPEALPEITDVWIGIDAAAKSKRKSDDSAIVIVGKAVDNYLYVLETFSRKVPTEELIDTVLMYSLQYLSKLREIRIEDVVFQLLLKDLMDKKARENGLFLPFVGIKVPLQQNKEMKLRSLITPVRNGHYKFRKDQRKLLEEMRRFPKGASDNLLDALWTATQGVLGGSISTFAFTSLSTASPRASLYNFMGNRR